MMSMSFESPHGGDVWLVERLMGIGALSLIDFSSNVNPYGPSPRAVKAVVELAPTLSLYPDDECLKLRQSLSEHYDLDPANFIVGNGSTELIYLFARVFVGCGLAGVHIPTFSEYERAVASCGGSCLYTKPHVQGAPSVEELMELMDGGVKALFICNPNNPNGSVMRAEELEEVLEEAEKRGVYVLLDEDFVELADEGSARSFICEVEKFSKLVVLRSFTKSHGLAGLRVGYAAASREAISRMEAARVRWNVNLLAQEAAVAALQDGEHVEAARRLVKSEKPRLMREVQGLEWAKPIYGYANFLLVELSGVTSRELKMELARRSFLIRDCSNFRGLNDRYIRVAVKRSWENELLIEELKKLEVKRSVN